MKRVVVWFIVASAAVALGSAARSRAGEIGLSEPQPGGTRALSFPAEQWVGNLYLEPEAGMEWSPERVRPEGQWESIGPALGDVRVPAERNVRLSMRLGLSRGELVRFQAENPWAYRQVVADRTRRAPHDLSGLSGVDPNGLFWLAVYSASYERRAVPAEVFEPLRRLTGLEMLTLSSTGITDKGFEHLRPLHGLKGLEVTQLSISRRGLAVLKDLPALEYLSVCTGVTDAGLKEVAGVSSMRWLSIVGGKMWGPGLAELARLPRLERLCFWGARDARPVGDRHMKYLEGLTRLKSLTLWGLDETFTDAGLASIGKIEGLEELHFVLSRPAVTPGGIAHLKNLRKIDFAHTWVGRPGERHGDDVARAVAALPRLESVKGIGYLSAEGMRTLGTMRRLKCLVVALKDRHQQYRGPTGLSHVAGLSDLEELTISSDDPLSDADAASLESLSSLKKLCIFRPALSDRGLASIGKLKGLEYLHLSAVPRTGLNHLNGLSRLKHLKVASFDMIAEPAGAAEVTLDLSGLRQMRDMNLTGLPLRDDDLAFLKNLPLLDNLMVQPDPQSSLTGKALHHLAEIPQLYRLWVSELTQCDGEDIAHLNRLSELRTLTLRGDITDRALTSLRGLPSLETLYVFTDHPIRAETVAELTGSHPVMEHIHIHELTQVHTRPANVPTRR